MSNKKQSSIDYINKVAEILGEEIVNKLSVEQKFRLYYLDRDLKAIHKQEIIDAVDFSNKKWSSEKVEVIINGQQYYNETFGGQDNE